MRRVRPLLVSIVIAAGCTTAEARAGAGSEASDHHRAGVAYAKSGKWEQAVREFEEAYALDPTPIRLYDLGQVCAQARQFVCARDAYAKIADHPSLSTEQQQRARAGLSTAQSNIGRVRVTVLEPKPSDVVTIDGERVHAEVVDVDPGKHTVRLVRDGESNDVAIDVAPGAESNVTVAPPTKQAAPVDSTPPPHPSPAPRRDGPPLGGWVLGGVSLAFLATATVFWVLGQNERDDLLDRPCSQTRTCDESGLDKFYIGDAFGIAGGVAAIGAGYFFVSWALDRPANAGAAPSGGLIRLGGRF